MITGPTGTTKRARRLRSEMSLPQTMLWRELRKRPGGFKFRREHGAGDYFLDFYVASLKLDIEIDGSAHDSAPAVARDQKRSHWLRSQGVATVRIPAKAILEDIDAVIVRLVQVCDERKAKLALRRNPPPSGEGDHAQHRGGARAPSETSPGFSTSRVPLHPSPAASGPPPRDGEDCVRETGFAKINLALHVRARRDDGYHELETLFAFVDAGDVLTARVAERDGLTTLGEFSSSLDPFGNLVAKALNALPRPEGLAITLEKNLPVAAGLGGGSADAGAVFRIVRECYGLPEDWRARAAKLGADVPACVESVTCIGRGTGTELEPADDSLAGTPVLLVNPRVPLSTRDVFAGWGGVDRGPLPVGDARTIALAGRNDLEAPAIRLCPPITEVLAALHGTSPWLARMSGSGATCFALYDSEASRDVASEKVHADHPDWWQLKGRLR